MGSDTTIKEKTESSVGQCVLFSYALITPARNEAKFIELTIKSVINQTVLPSKWVIVSDGSTDGTDDIVIKYTSKFKWIELMRMPERAERNFAGKAHAVNTGYAKLKKHEYDYIGIMDADISFDSEYFAFLLSKLNKDPKLGIAGTGFVEGKVTYDYRFSRKEHVSGMCQLFRRECFESVGGYIPLKNGGVDLTAVVTARMNGWKTETFTDKMSIHYRPMGSGRHKIVKTLIISGYGDYILGVHPVWQLFRSVYQMSRKPILIGGSLLMTGYLWAMLTCAHKPVSKEFVRFRRKEQLQWLKEYFRKAIR